MKTASQAGAEPMRIGTLARMSGCSVPTIRYYESVGLIPMATRRTSGHRVYAAEAVQMLAFIRRCRDFGFPIEQTRALVSLSKGAGRDCVEARDIAQEQLVAVRGKLLELMELERGLSGFVDACNDNCVGGAAPACTIFRDLAPVTAGGCC